MVMLGEQWACLLAALKVGSKEFLMVGQKAYPTAALRGKLSVVPLGLSADWWVLHLAGNLVVSSAV